MTRQRLQDALAAWNAAKQIDDELCMYIAGQRMAHAIEEILDDQPPPRDVATEVAQRLVERPHEGLSHDTIKKWCVEAEQQFADAPIKSFVPILVENIVSNRILGRYLSEAA